MLYYLSQYLTQFWGPFRLLQSHALLLAGGAFTAAFLTLALLPRLWDRLPRDRGKAICKDLGGMKSAGKPTGAGYYVTLLLLPVVLVFAPLKFWDLMTVLLMYGAMLFGYLDDRASVPWGELRKGLLDAVVSIAIACCLFFGHAEHVADGLKMIVWLPFVKSLWHVPFRAYVPAAAFIL